MRISLFIFAAGSTLVFLISNPAFSNELALATGSVPYAPTEVTRSEMPAFSLSRAERKDLVQQFEGVLYMATQDRHYQTWPGRSMSDCYSAKELGLNDSWTYRCEMITPNTHAFYYFYPVGQGNSAHLRDMEVNFKVVDMDALPDFKVPVQKLLGRGRPLDAAPTGWQWGVDGQEATLYADVTRPDANGLAPLRFHWTVH